MKFSSLILCLCFVHFAVAQSLDAQRRKLHPDNYVFRIHSGLPDYSFHLLRDHDGMAAKIEVRTADKQVPIQILEVPDDTDVPPHNVALFAAEDINCDGYLDIKVLHVWNGRLSAKGTMAEDTQNVTYYFWLFDRNSGQFVFDNQLSNLPNLKQDCRTGQIISHSKITHDDLAFTEKSLKYEGSKLQLLTQIDQGWNNTSNCYARITARNDEGQLKVVDRECVVAKK